ncbi:MAG: hypothetical protein ACRC50_00090, partial [Gaiella sp.]
RTRLVAAVGEGCPTSFRFAVGPVPSPAGDPPAHAPAPPAIGPHEAALAADVSSAVEDPELRELVRRAAAASLAGHRAGRGL